MISEIILVGGAPHPQDDEAGYHFMIDAFVDGTADLLAVKHTGSGWGESGPADDIITAAKQLAWELSDAGYRVVLSYSLPKGVTLRRSSAKLRVVT